jgi:hypothetical protein
VNGTAIVKRKLSTIFAKTVLRYLPIGDELIAVVYRRFTCSSVCRGTVKMGRRVPVCGRI